MRWYGTTYGMSACGNVGFVAGRMLCGLLLLSAGCCPPFCPEDPNQVDPNQAGRSLPLAVDAGPDVTTAIGVAVQLAATVSGGEEPYSLQWSPSDGLDDASILQPKATPQDTTVYTLSVTDSLGATASDQVTVTVATPPDTVAVICGSVTDANTKQTLGGVLVRIDRSPDAPLTATTGAAGQYLLPVPTLPDFFALSASLAGYIPSTRGLAATDIGADKPCIDFELEPSRADTIVIEVVPDVHHLGDDNFGGAINSQFQKTSEGATYSAKFQVAASQLPPTYNAGSVRMLLKGAELDANSMRVNDQGDPKSLGHSPDDGSFGLTEIDFDIADLRLGENTLTVSSATDPVLGDDLDDFEFVNVQIRLRLAAAADKFALWNGGVKLRGANMVQRHVYPELDGPDFLGPGPLGPPYTQDDFDQLAALGANCVLLSHTGLFTVDPPYVVDDDAQANLDRLIAMAAKADLFAVINGRSGPGRSEFDLIGRGWLAPKYIDDAVWSDAAAQDAWAAMWQYTADRYKDNPTVIGYELMCEPDATVVLNVFDQDEFTQKYGGTTYDWNTLYPKLTAAIRAVDTQTPILVGAESYSNVSWLPHLVPSDDPRTVYTVHFYNPMTYTHQAEPRTLSYPGMMPTDDGGPPQMVDGGWLLAQLQPVRDFAAAHGAPVAITEFGVYRFQPGAATYLADVLAALENSGVNHTLWLWSSSWGPQADVDEFDLKHGTDPANHAAVPGNELVQAVQAVWARNVVRPSNWR